MYLQGVVDGVVTMCKPSSGNTVILIDKHGLIGAFDVRRHVALWTQTIQVRCSVIFCHGFQFQFRFRFSDCPHHHVTYFQPQTTYG